MTRNYSLVSLFSGAGGLDLGFKLSNRFEIVVANDILPIATETYSQNFGAKLVKSSPKLDDIPAVYNGDVATLDFTDLEKLKIDVVIGGPPCQDFSVVRGPKEERKGIQVKRGRLYMHFVRALIHLQPKAFVFENVPGLRSANGGQAYKTILEDFGNLEVKWDEMKSEISNGSQVNPKGYEIIFKGVINASKLGVPQARRRIIIIGIRKDLVNQNHPKIESLKQKVRNLVEGKNTVFSIFPLTCMEVFEGKPLSQLGNEYRTVMKEYSELTDSVKTPKAIEWEENVWNKLTFDIIEDYLKLNRMFHKHNILLDEVFDEHSKLLKELEFTKPVSDVLPDDYSNVIGNESANVKARMLHIPPNENYSFVDGTKWSVIGKGMSLIYRRIHPLKPSYTVVAHGGGGTWGYHYERNRGKMTSRERARLQTFPDNFLFKGKTAQVRAQIGEAVPPLMAKRLAENVAFILDELE